MLPWILKHLCAHHKSTPNKMQSGNCEILSELAMQSLGSEPTFYFKGSLLFLVHVDDPLVASTDEDIEWICRELGQRTIFKAGPRLEIGKPVKYLGKMCTMTEHGFEIPSL